MGPPPNKNDHYCPSPVLGPGSCTTRQRPEPCGPPPALVIRGVEGLAEGRSTLRLSIWVVGQGKPTARPGQRRLGEASCQELSSPLMV